MRLILRSCSQTGSRPEPLARGVLNDTSGSSADPESFDSGPSASTLKKPTQAREDIDFTEACALLCLG